MLTSYFASRPQYCSPNPFSDISQRLLQSNNGRGAGLQLPDTFAGGAESHQLFVWLPAEKAAAPPPPPPPVPSVSCTQFPQGCPCSASVIKASVAWLLPPLQLPRRAPAWKGRVRRPAKASPACDRHESRALGTPAAALCRHVKATFLPAEARATVPRFPSNAHESLWPPICSPTSIYIFIFW